LRERERERERSKRFFGFAMTMRAKGESNIKGNEIIILIILISKCYDKYSTLSYSA